MNLWESPEIVRLGDPDDGILREVAAEVVPADREPQRVAKRLLALLGASAGEFGVGGIAAPQIRESLRIVAVNLSTGARAMFNPRIREASPVEPRESEGCFSLPPDRRVLVPRSSWVVVDFADRKGRAASMILSGRDARLVQHELDHLDGVLVTDYEDGARPRLRPARARRAVETTSGEG